MDTETVDLELEWRNPEETSALDRWQTYRVSLTLRQLGELLAALDVLNSDGAQTPAALSRSELCAAKHVLGCTCRSGEPR
jgi:hypothetical protein